MGCGSSAGGAKSPEKKGKDAAAAAAKAEKAREKAARRKNLDPKDFVVSKQERAAVVKEEGSICGEQFNVEECRDCDVFLLDHIATAFIDECKNCRIFVGPVHSSVFVRDCKDCDLVIACQQFRSRDCSNCRIALFCMTEPIIETSSNMQFACFDFGYFSLRQQLDQAGLKVFNNKWWQVYDFNKNPDRPNWSLLPQGDASRLLRLEACNGAISQEELAMDRVVPLTLGTRPRPSQDSCMALFILDGAEQEVEAFLVDAARSEGWFVCRARSIVLGEEQLKSLLGWTKEHKLPSLCKGKEVIGVEVCGEGIWARVQEAIGASKSVRVVPQAETASLSKAFFETWKDEV